MNVDNVLLKPKITEKSLSKTGKNVYGFVVNIKANKNNIREAVEKIFNVSVSNVDTLIKKGKFKRVGKKMAKKKRSDYKIAYVSLKKGKIDLFPVTK